VTSGTEASVTGSRPCRSCAGPLAVILDLGSHPPAGVFPRGDESPPGVRPLRLAVCTRCALVQLGDETMPEAELPDAPAPTSSATMAAHARTLVDGLVGLGASRVVSLASHGGHLWPFLRERGMDAVVVEGMPHWRARLREGGATVVDRDPAVPGWSSEVGQGWADLVIEHYLLSHVDRPDVLIAEIAECLRPGGLLVMEFDHLLPTVRGLQFDAIRHGHHTYLTLGWVATALLRHGLVPIRAEQQQVYGGAMRVFAVRGAGTADASVDAITGEETAAGIDQAIGFGSFRAGVERITKRTVRYLERAREDGRRVVGYGAPARAVTFLSACGIGPGLLPSTVDRSPAKHGRVIPGAGIPIEPPDALDRDVPDDLLVLTWDIAGEVRQQLLDLEARGMRTIVAVPELSVVTDDGLMPLHARPGTD
jgi:SAM-dependent methyltransferase